VTQRHRMFAGAAIVIVFGSCALPAAAQEDGRWGFGVTGGTLGVGPQLTYRAGPHFGVRANATFLSLSRDAEVDDIDYSGDADLRSFGAAVDWYPTGAGLRVSLGGRVNDTSVDLDAAPTTGVTVGDTTYTPQQLGALAGTVTVDEFAPLLTVGYGGKLGQGFTFGAEVGVMWQGAPRIDNLRATGPLAGTTLLQADIEREEQRIQDELDEYELWPIVQLEFQYRF
jgi:hypothetical protein